MRANDFAAVVVFLRTVLTARPSWNSGVHASERTGYTTMASAYEIRRVLKIYDDAAVASPKLAITMLKEVTKSISGAPAKYDLTSDDPEAWAEAGGHSYGEAPEFPCLVGARWMEVLQKPGIVAAVGFDKNEWAELLKELTDYEAKLDKEGLSLDVMEELTEHVNKLREEAPEPEDSDDDEDEDDDDSDEDE